MNLRSIAAAAAAACWLVALLPGLAAMPAHAADALVLPALKAAAYRVEGLERRVRLVDGRWAGRASPASAQPGPTLRLAFDFAARGDLDGDGREDAVVVLLHEPGGSGVFVHLAVLSERKGRAVNVATQLLGDRVQVRELRIAAGRLEADLVEAGPGDPVCCPTRTVRRAWTLEGGRLRAQPLAQEPGRLSVADLAGEWELVQWRAAEALAPQGRPTMSWQDGRLAGFTGCNRYTASAGEGAAPGEIRIGQIATTRMACEEQAMAQEKRFTDLLGKVGRFSFHPGGLMMSYDLGGSGGAMGFMRKP